MRRRGGLRSRAWWFVVVVAAIMVVACNSLLDFDQFIVGPTTDGGMNLVDAPSNGQDAPNDVNNVVVDSSGGTKDTGAADANDLDAGGCINPTGFGGRGCYRCKPTTQDQLLRACTASRFETFDNVARIKDFDASDPRPAIDNGGAQPPTFDAGSGGSSSGGSTLNDGGCPLGNPAFPNPVMVYGATGLPMETIAKAMGTAATMYYIAADSCQGVGAAVVQQPKMAGYATYYDTAGIGHSCRLAPEFGNDAQQNSDVAISGLFPDSCSNTDVGGGTVLPAGTQLPNDWKDFGGAVNPAMFAVPPTSSEKVISAEAAYRVYAFGSGTSALAKGVTPWIDENFIFRRTETSGTQQTIARALEMPFAALRGVNTGSSGNMHKALVYVSTSQAANADNALGISTSEVVDVNRADMRSLAYQHFGMPVGFYPDSDVNLFDRRNVRDGHYPLWLALHVFARIDGNGDPAAATNTDLDMKASTTKTLRDAAVRKLVNVMSNRAAAPVASVDLFGALKIIGDVPTCAMTVSRTGEGSDLIPFTPATACGCAFEAANPGSAPPECIQCSGAKPCSGTTRTSCNFGYCE